MKKRVWSLLVGAFAAGMMLTLAGCATPKLAGVQAVQNDDAAYLVFGTLGQTAKQTEVARRIAGRAYNDVKAKRPSPDRRTLDAWEDFLAALEKPIPIDTQTYRTAPELKAIGDLQLVSNYIKNNPSAMNLSGPDLLPAWADDLAAAQSTVAEIRGVVDAALKEAQALADKKEWAAAYAAIGQAVTLAPKDNRIRRLAQQVQDNLAAATSTDLGRVVKQITDLKKNFGTKQSNLKMVADAERLLAPALEQATAIERLLADVSIPFTDKDTPAKLANLSQSALDLSGPTWAELIRLHAEDKQFWAAYEITLRTLAQIAETPALAKTDAAQLVTRAYADQLADGVRHLLEQSNEAFYSDRFGTAFLASRMSRELFDYAGRLGVEVPSTALASVQQADQTAEDAANRIRAQYTRRLLITDFVPAVTEDYENIGFQIRTRSRYLALPGNGLAWALEVPAAKSLVLDTMGARTPLDLVLSGVMDKKVQVDVLPPVELERGYTEVGTERIRQVPNPLHGLRDGELRMVFQQEVHLYPWIKTMHRKQARIALRVVREYLNAASRTIYHLDETYPNQDMHFEGLDIESEDLTYHPLVIGSPRIANGRTDFKVESAPIGKAPDIAPDDEVARAVINHVINGVMAAIEQEVAQFPVEGIAVRALEHQSKNQTDPAADVWGQFLVYIDKVAPVSDPPDTAWLTRREALRAFVVDWNQTRWKDQAEDVRAGIAQAWNNALAAYLAAD